MRNRKISYLELCRFLEKRKNKKDGIVRFADVRDCTIFNIPSNKEILSLSSSGRFFFGYKIDRCKIKNNNYIKI